MRYTDRLADAGIAPSVGRCGDAYDNALAESVIGFFKTDVIQRKGPWRSLDGAEFATLEWVDWFNTRRLLGTIGDIPPAEFEAQYYAHSPVTIGSKKPGRSLVHRKKRRHVRRFQPFRSIDVLSLHPREPPRQQVGDVRVAVPVHNGPGLFRSGCQAE